MWKEPSDVYVKRMMEISAQQEGRCQFCLNGEHLLCDGGTCNCLYCSRRLDIPQNSSRREKASRGLHNTQEVLVPQS